MTATPPAAGDKTRTSPDNEGEKPVREQLKKASIDATATKTGEENSAAIASGAVDEDKDTAAAGEASSKAAEPTEEAPRGRPQCKRSFDEATAGQEEEGGESKQGRKRSRENAPGSDEEQSGSSKRVSLDASRDGEDTGTATNGDKAGHDTTPPTEEKNGGSSQEVASPKLKRSRIGGAVGDTNGEAGATSAGEKTTKEAEHDGAVKSDEKQAPMQTSSSAFAASGFGAFASSSTSGFGAVAPEKKLSSFASPEPEDKQKTTKPATSSFGGALGATSAFGGGSKSSFGGSLGAKSAFGGGGSGSTFGSASNGGSAFGTTKGFGGGFGSGFGSSGGAKLSTFASSSGATAFGGAKKTTKAFGAPTAGDDEDGEETSANEGDETDAEKKAKTPLASEEEKRDERFYAQQLETGEENEKTEYTCRAKLYNFVSADPSEPTSKKEWKERGLGTLRLNVKNSPSSSTVDLEAGDAKATTSAGDDDKQVRARLVMRADGSHRVILNTPIQKELGFGSVKGDAPVGGYIYFMGSIDGSSKLELLQLKTRQQFAVELYENIQGLQKAM